MKIQYCSDLHLEFDFNRQYLRENPIKPVGEILVLAGDLMPFTIIDNHKRFFDYLSDNFKMVYWIPGNHEYYHTNLTDRFSPLREAIRSNVFLVNNLTTIEGDVTLVFSTLWSRIDDHCEAEIKARMNDFRLIRYGDRLLTPSDVNMMHSACKDFLNQSITERRTKKCIAITHHVPTLFNYPEKYRGDVLNAGFATELSALIEASEVDYWIFGHHHQNMQPFKVGKTELLTNQLGYVHRNEHLLFKCDQILTL